MMGYIAGVKRNEETPEYTLTVYEGYYPDNSFDYRTHIERAEKLGRNVFTVTGYSRRDVQDAAANVGYLLDTHEYGSWKFVDHTLQAGVMVYCG